MTSKEVIELIGKPKEKQPIFGSEFWAYKDYLLVFKNDTLTKINTKEEMKEGFKELGKSLKNLK